MRTISYQPDFSFSFAHNSAFDFFTDLTDKNSQIIGNDKLSVKQA